jgi:hypothetical protein
MLSRRRFAIAPVAGAAICLGANAQLVTESSLPLPNRQLFQGGDFLWPKKPGAFVPYRAGTASPFDLERQQWTRERQQFLERERSKPNRLPNDQLDAIRGMDFREFHARYAADQRPGVPGAYSTGGGIYVGHMGILEVDSGGTPWVIEALWEKGVVRNTYEDWLRNRPGEVVWLGRLRDIDADARERVVAEAKRHVGKPYDFWNFNLLDDNAFYCSKLAWLSIMRTQGFAVDGNPDPDRGFWFSPKQMLYSKPIARLHDPGPYAN